LGKIAAGKLNGSRGAKKADAWRKGKTVTYNSQKSVFNYSCNYRKEAARVGVSAGALKGLEGMDKACG
jgi:hypothetical protein